MSISNLKLKIPYSGYKFEIIDLIFNSKIEIKKLEFQSSNLKLQIKDSLTTQ